MFQSTLPCGERHANCERCGRPVNRFNPRSRAGSDTNVLGLPILGTSKFQSTLPCGERRTTHIIPFTRREVSIHAPVRGATHIHNYLQFVILVSIHAPVRGATWRLPIFPIRYLRFQSTLPCGERPFFCHFFPPLYKFQSTLPCGERPDHSVPMMQSWRFQSTLPCGERHTFLNLLCRS